MELRRQVPFKPSKELQAKFDLEKQQKEEASKHMGDYLISLTNTCFDKCINTDKIIFTKNEDKCLNSCFYKFSELHFELLQKFKEINKKINIERSEDYGDYYGFLSTFFDKESYSKNNKDLLYHK